MTPDFEEKQSGFSGIFFWFFAGAALFMFLGVHALWGSEGRLAETAREMLASGDFFHPAQNWQIQPVRSPLYFWTMIPFMQFFGIEELAVRVPGVLFSLAGLRPACGQCWQQQRTDCCGQQDFFHHFSEAPN